MHRIRGPVVLRRRGHRVRHRHRLGAARGRGRRRCTGRAGGPQPAAACRRDHRVPRRRSPCVDDLLLPIAGSDRPRHREARVVGHHRRLRGLDGAGDRRRQAHRQCGRGDLADGAHRCGRTRARASRRITSAYRNRTRCGPPDSDERHHRPAKATGHQDGGAGAHGVQRDKRREGSAGRATGVRLLAVRRHRGMSVGRRCLQRAADRDARAVHCRRVCSCGEDAPSHPLGSAARGFSHAARRRRAQGRPGLA